MASSDVNKDWTDIASEVVGRWTETSTLMWKNWFDLMSLVPTEIASTETVPELKDVSKKFLGNRELAIDFLQLSIDAWKSILPQVKAGDDWQHTLNKSIEKMREQFNKFSLGAIRIGQDSTELWEVYLQQMQKFNQLWVSSWGFTELLGQASTGKSSALIEMNNLYWDLLYNKGFGSLMQTPSLGLSREINGKVMDNFESWRHLYQASADYQVVLGEIQVKSFEALIRKLVLLTEEGKTVKDWREFQTIWSEVADQVFENAFFHEKNLKIRGKFLNALNSYRIKEQELKEVYLKMMNVPLRSEVDEIHQTIYELRKEVKRLKKIVGSSESNSVMG